MATREIEFSLQHIISVASYETLTVRAGEKQVVDVTVAERETERMIARVTKRLWHEVAETRRRLEAIKRRGAENRRDSDEATRQRRRR